jgi:tryptophan synthase beta chain
MRLAKQMPGATILVNLSGRGDKDMGTAMEWFGLGEDRGEVLDPDATDATAGEPA